jgi:hypothetical protein
VKTSSPSHAPPTTAPATDDAFATSTARAATSGWTGVVPGSRRMRARSARPPIASATPSTASVMPPSSGKPGSEP